MPLDPLGPGSEAREEGRPLSHGALGQVRVLRKCQDIRYILKGVGTLAILEDVKRTTCPETQWIHAPWAPPRTWWFVL